MKATEFIEMTQNNGHHAIQSFKVTDFGTNWKPIYDFLLVINLYIPPVLHRFQVMADYCEIFASDRECLNLTPSVGVISVNIRMNFTSPETRMIQFSSVQFSDF